jgi:two-component system cell cycle response regulator
MKNNGEKLMSHAILIVDDDEALIEPIEEYLTTIGYDTKSVNNAADALEMLTSFKADIVLTDILMEGMDGLELTKRIKASYDIDVIVMTGYSADYSYGEAVKTGASDFIFKPFRFEELNLRIKRVLREAEFKNERNKLLKELEELAITDALTSLYNSRHFFSEIKIELKRHNRYSRPLSLLILDIDFFKNYNDTWGHLEGDKVLMEIGKTIKSCMRSMDTAYRYGGEEFTILLPETKLQKACLVGTRIKESISSKIFHPKTDTTKSVTVSLGATQMNPEETLESFMSRADKALYQSKDTGRNKLTYILPDNLSSLSD